MLQMLPVGKGAFKKKRAVTLKLAQIVLINDNNNLCEGISQKFKIEHKREKCNIQHVSGMLLKNDIF